MIQDVRLYFTLVGLSVHSTCTTASQSAHRVVFLSKYYPELDAILFRIIYMFCTCMPVLDSCAYATSSFPLNIQYFNRSQDCSVGIFPPETCDSYVYVTYWEGAFFSADILRFSC